MRMALVLGIIAVIALTYWGMYRGWQARVASQRELPLPQPQSSEPTVAGPWSGIYLGATRAGRWLDRIDAHSLGARSLVRLRLTAHAIDLERENERSFSIPRTEVIGVRADKGIAGRAFEDGGIIVISFRLGQESIDIGMRFPDTAEHLAALSALSQEVAS
ncbi:MAG: PH-like domain-containing protein [Candidatus Nanopelagicales bacterium]